MKFKSSLIVCTIFTSIAYANPVLDRIKDNDPESYMQAKIDCEAWAENEEEGATNLQKYMDQCMLDAVGYLDESYVQNEYDEENEGYVEEEIQE